MLMKAIEGRFWAWAQCILAVAAFVCLMPMPAMAELPDAVFVEVYQDDVLYGVYEVRADGDWQIAVQGLPKYDGAGRPHVYEVRERPVPGYVAEVYGQANPLLGAYYFFVENREDGGAGGNEGGGTGEGGGAGEEEGDGGDGDGGGGSGGADGRDEGGPDPAPDCGAVDGGDEGAEKPGIDKTPAGHDGLGQGEFWIVDEEEPLGQLPQTGSSEMAGEQRQWIANELEPLGQLPQAGSSEMTAQQLQWIIAFFRMALICIAPVLAMSLYIL